MAKLFLLALITLLVIQLTAARHIQAHQSHNIGVNWGRCNEQYQPGTLCQMGMYDTAICARFKNGTYMNYPNECGACIKGSVVESVRKIPCKPTFTSDMKLEYYP